MPQEKLIDAAHPRETRQGFAAIDLHRGCVDQFQAWVGNEPAGPARDSWDEAAQDAVLAGVAAWVPDCISTAINWSITPASILRNRRTGNSDN